MSKRKIQKIIGELIKLIKEQYSDFNGLYLYGSQIKGTAHKNSDIDIVLLFNFRLTNKQALNLAGLIGNIEYLHNVFIDYHPFTMSELEQNPFYYESVVEEGAYFGKEAAA